MARRVMVVADPTRESSGALEWALSHALQENDDLIVLHVEPSSSRRHTFATLLKRQATSPALGGGSSSPGGGDHEFLDEMRVVCRAAQPKVNLQVETVDMDSRDKASVIILQAKLFMVDLIVVGQRRSLSKTLLGGKISGSMPYRGSETAEYLIENSKCPCVGVQKKGQNGGYLLNTKTRRNFWLLA